MRTFLDTNVLVYWVDDSARADAVEQLLAGESVISDQISRIGGGRHADDSKSLQCVIQYGVCKVPRWVNDKSSTSSSLAEGLPILN